MTMSIRKRSWTTASGETKTSWICDYRDQNGARAIRTFAKKGAAIEFETTMRGEVRDKKHVVASKSISIREAGDEWIEAVRQGRDDRDPAEASTLRQYRHHKRAYIDSALGNVLLAKLSNTDVIAFRNDLLARLSRPMARKVLTSLKGILAVAVFNDRVAVNVAASVKIGTGTRQRVEVTVPAMADVKAILGKLDELVQHPNKRIADAWVRRRALIAFAIHTGCRASEIRGLPWDAVDLKAGKIEVRQRADENGVIGPPKSKSGNRTIDIPASLVAILRELRLRSRHALVFASEEGNPQSLANIYNRAWAPIQIAAGVCDPKKDANGDVIRDEDGKPIMEPRYNFHSLRHYHASALIDAGANPKEVQSELGHSDVRVSFGIYGHLMTDEEAEQRRKDRAETLAARLS